MTNADVIRSLTDEGLEEFLKKIQDQEREDWCPIGCYHCIYNGTHHQPDDCSIEDCDFANGILYWLKSDAEIETRM